MTDHPPEHTSTGLVTEQTVRFLRQRSREPFVLWVSYPDPHEPYETPKAWFDRAPEVDLPPWDPGGLDTMPERNRILHAMLGLGEDGLDTLRATMRVYLANVLFIDCSVGRILDTLEDTGLADDTIVVFCSDHGDFTGEHRMTCKGGPSTTP